MPRRCDIRLKHMVCLLLVGTEMPLTDTGSASSYWAGWLSKSLSYSFSLTTFGDPCCFSFSVWLSFHFDLPASFSSLSLCLSPVTQLVVLMSLFNLSHPVSLLRCNSCSNHDIIVLQRVCLEEWVPPFSEYSTGCSSQRCFEVAAQQHHFKKCCRTGQQSTTAPGDFKRELDAEK